MWGPADDQPLPHLHWSLDVFAVPVNPLQWMKIGPCEAEPSEPPRRTTTDAPGDHDAN